MPANCGDDRDGFMPQFRDLPHMVLVLLAHILLAYALVGTGSIFVPTNMLRACDRGLF
jgi:hypothetical protein